MATLYHRPKPTQLDLHHILPLYEGGLEKGEQIPLCGSCHESVHALLREFDRAGGDPGWKVRIKYPRGVQHLAAEGWRRIVYLRSLKERPGA